MKSLIFLLLVIFMSCSQKEKGFKYPKTKKENIIDTIFGIKVEDPYRWLENYTSQEVKIWIEEQNNFTQAYLNNIKFRKRIKKRLFELVDYERISTPFKKGNYYFYYRNDGKQNQSTLCFTKNLNEIPTIIVDPNKLDTSGTTSLNDFNYYPESDILAYSLSKFGSDWQVIYFKKVSDLTDLNDSLVNVKFSNIAWYDNGVFYSAYRAEEKSKSILSNHKLYYHKIGTTQDQDIIVYEKDDPYVNIYAYNTPNDDLLVISERKKGHKGNALSIIDLTLPKLITKQIIKDYDFEYHVIYRKNEFVYVITNKDAPKYRLVKFNLNNLKFEDVISEKTDVLVNAVIIKDKIVVKYLHNAYSILKVFDLEGNFITDINLEGIGTVGQMTADETNLKVYFDFSSFIQPPKILELDLKTFTLNTIFEPKIKGFEPADYIVKQVFYRSKDSTEVPMFIVHKKDISLNSKNPTLLYGYGGFNISLTPSFSFIRLFWLEIGGIYAVANIRGGGEFGKEWHLAGTKHKKQNTFDDFISAAEYLINEKYTSKDYLVIQGGSNGGMLVGAVVNQRPDLFKVALPSVGVMDMLRFHKFTIGWAWISDYGNPDVEEDFKYLITYSPLHNIKENNNYPAIFVTTADHDDRVVPSHSFKYIATLQEKCKGPNPVLIRIETKTGHGKGKPLKKIIEEQSDIYAFTLYNLNLYYD